MTENPEGVELGWASQEGRELGPRRGKRSHWPGPPHKVAETKQKRRQEEGELWKEVMRERMGGR